MIYFNELEPYAAAWLRKVMEMNTRIQYNASRGSASNATAALTATLAKQEQSIMADSSVRANLRNGKRRDRNSQRVAEMYAAYTGGKSLAEVADQFGISRQAVFGVFEARGLKLRKRVFLPAIEFNGQQYTIKTNGYYRATSGSRNPLHRDVWEFHNGQIPDGFDIHHKDGNKTNNVIDNLQCLTKAEHTRSHNPAQAAEEKQCPWCGSLVPRIRYANGVLESPSRMRRKQFCNSMCASEWKRGRRRGSTA